MKTLQSDRWRRDILERVERIEPRAAPRWGRMSAPEMIAHITASMRMATGEVRTDVRRDGPIRWPIVKQLIVYFLPIPKGLPTAPELQPVPQQLWESGLRDLRVALASYAARPASQPWPDHPAFGALSRREWGVLTYRHLDHHLRQFGA